MRRQSKATDGLALALTLGLALGLLLQAGCDSPGRRTLLRRASPASPSRVGAGLPDGQGQRRTIMPAGCTTVDPRKTIDHGGLCRSQIPLRLGLKRCGMWPLEVCQRALAPALAHIRERLCRCLGSRHVSRRGPWMGSRRGRIGAAMDLSKLPWRLRFSVYTEPHKGRSVSALFADVDTELNGSGESSCIDHLQQCMGKIEVRYPAFELPGCLVKVHCEPSGDPRKPRCVERPSRAVFSYPLRVHLRAPAPKPKRAPRRDPLLELLKRTLRN